MKGGTNGHPEPPMSLAFCHDCHRPVEAGRFRCKACEVKPSEPLKSELVPVSSPSNGADTSSDTAPKPLKLATVAEWAERPDTQLRWLVNKLLPKHGMAILSASSKAGKSTLTRNLTHTVSAGEGEWLGHECGEGNVLYLPLEEGAATVVSHFRKLGAAGERIWVLDQRPPDNSLRAGLLEEAIQRVKPALVVIDTLIRWIPLKPKMLNDYGAVSSSMGPYIEMAHEHGTCIVFVHHSKKSGGRNGEEICGSVALPGSFDTILSMRWRGSTRTLYAFGRDDVKLDEIVLGYSEETGKVTNTMSKVDADKASIENRVMEFLGDEGGWTENKVVKRGVKGKSNYIVASLQRLCEHGIVSSRKKPGRGGGIQYCLSELVSAPLLGLDTGTSSDFSGESEEEVPF